MIGLPERIAYAATPGGDNDLSRWPFEFLLAIIGV
jgi:hypothetical protein